MSKDQNDSSQASEIGRISKLAERLREYDLNQIDLHDAERRIRIRRGAAALLPSIPAAYGAAPVATAGGTPSSPPARPEDDKSATYIKSPMVGSFYSRSKPDQPSYVKIGDVVAPETIVCIVEAMKMFNEIPAGIAGKIVEVCVKDGEPVDVNKPLFKVAI